MHLVLSSEATSQFPVSIYEETTEQIISAVSAMTLHGASPALVNRCIAKD